VPFQNRVDPSGRLHAVPARGAWMGNRGVLIDADRRVVAPWRLKRWITCVLRFRDRHREVFTPGRYTELFFLDEATSLAAGHRPCAECGRARYEEFRAAWARTKGGSQPSAVEMDEVLHAERLRPDGEKRTWRAPIRSLPGGVIVEHVGSPHLWWGGALRRWSFEGYGTPRRVAGETRVAVLTPRSTVRAIRAGFTPQVHESAG
jgi:hypothetical protein